MRRMRIAAAAFLLSVFIGVHAQTAADVHWDTPGAGNPLLPGYFADPTIRKFGDTYYIYATTDGNGNGYGPAQVWMSRDFRNWTCMTMSWPTTEVVWAPDVMQASDGSFRYFYCQPCVLHEGVGETPRGPWRNVLGKDDAVLVPDRFVHNAITLDGQTFVDDDGATYIYFGTWGIYDGFGCGVARFGDDLKSFTDKRLIPNTEVKDFFEAPYVLKRNGTYYFMYSSGSCHDHTYRVQYATSTVGPMGPYEYRGCILETNADMTVHGPGHHSVLQDGDDYYIVYHRHNIPRSTHGFHRQVCIDRLVFAPDGSIEKVVPTHEGVVPRSLQGGLAQGLQNGLAQGLQNGLAQGLPLQFPAPENIAFGAKATASSYYSEDFRPAYAIDDNNATLWKPATCNGEDWLQIDLGSERHFDQVWTQFEYATYYYQYKIETSTDGQDWALYADKTRNTLAASPLVDRGSCTARYLRITVTGREKNGHFGGIWNVKVFDNKQSTINNKRGKREALALDVPPQLQVAVAGGSQWENNGGMLGGSFVHLPDGRMQATFGTDFLFTKGQPYTVTYRQQGKIIAYISDGSTERFYADGQLQGKTGMGRPGISKWTSPLTLDADIENLRIFSYALQPAEVSFYAQHPVTNNVGEGPVPVDVGAGPVPARSESGPIVSISANDYPIGTSLTAIANHPVGTFLGDEPLQVELLQGRQAFRFTGRQLLRSDFPMPPTLNYSAPYTVSAWVLNPVVERVECIAQLMPVRHDLSTVELCNGSDPQNGLMMHNASFENSGSPLIKEREGQWQHWTVTYDGYMERQYLDGRLVAEKNMMLLLRPQSFMQIGASFDGSNPFDGYLHSLQVYDRTLSASEVQALYEQPTESPVLFLLQPAAGYAGAVCQPYGGRLALLSPLQTNILTDSIPARTATTVTIAFALQKGAKRVNLLDGMGVHIEASPKGIILDGKLTKAPLSSWNLLTITATGHCWLNGQPLTPHSSLITHHSSLITHHSSLIAHHSSLTIGDKGAAIASLVVSSVAITEEEACQAYATFTAAPDVRQPVLTVAPLTPQLVRLTVDQGQPSGVKYAFSAINKESQEAGSYTSDTSSLVNISSPGRHTFQAMALDTRGNVALSVPVSLTIDDNTFTTVADDFDTPMTLTSSVSASDESGWGLLTGTKATDVKATVAGGQLTLQSANGNFNASADDNAVLFYREVTGDFVVQGRLAGLMGSDRRQTPAYNEGGLMVLDDSRHADQQIVQAGIFPSYNCGNMLTTVSHHGRRPQYPTGTGWQYEPYMQIERQGSTFHVRTSPDGHAWHDAPGSPVTMPSLTADKPLKVGFFQVTYTDKLGTATFDDFRLWQAKSSVP